MKTIQFFLPIDPPTATHQEKKINWKTKSVYPDPAAADARAKLRAHIVQHAPDEPLSGPIRMTVVWQDGTEESWLRRTAGSGSHSVFRDREEVMNNASGTASGAGRR